MRAHLARHVSRRALVSRPRMPSCAVFSSPSRRQIPVIPSSWRNIICRRTFFGIFQKAPRQIKKPEYEPGWTVVLTWRNRTLDNLRPPPRKELVEAFRELFSYKQRFGVAVNSTQARHSRNLLRYLLENPHDEPDEGLTLLDLTTARDALLKPPKEDRAEHLEFSKALYEAIKRERELLGEDESASTFHAGGQGDDEGAAAYDLKAYLWALTEYGASTEARTELRKHWAQLKAAGLPLQSSKALWLIVLRGFAHEGREEELLETASEAEKEGVDYTPGFHHTMTEFFAKQDRSKETRKWFTKPITGNKLPRSDTYKELLLFSSRGKNREWVNPVFQQLVDANPSKPYWDIVYQWAVLSMGKGLDDLKGMFQVVAKHNPDDPSVLPDVDTINGLIEVAVNKNDPYLADRLLSFASELGIQPNAMTFILQMDSRIKAKDLSAARESYRSLSQSSLQGEEDLPVINRYLQALCDMPQPDLKAIREILDVLEQRIVTLDPDTVVALCTVYLKYDQQFDIIDTLSLNIFQHSTDQRKSVRDAFIAYCLDRKNSTARVWDAYSILRQFFLETGVEDRTELMQAFFERKRPDMAIHVFGHMRQHVNRSFHPTIDTYIQCFEGLGNCADPDAKEHLALVHNMLKMDLAIQPNTRLYNALMLAYAACGRPARAMDFWHDIVRSAEGPSYSSLEIVFAVCEKLPYGDQTAREIWKKLETLEVDVPPSVFAAYVGGLAGNGNVAVVQEAIKGMPQTVGYGPDVMTLGIAHNALPGQTLQRKFADWAAETYPKLWSEVKRKRYHRTSNGLIKYKLQRTLRA
ncbi:complex I intermediate-associated protein [Sodiomyces alkalinus F11]|uniref:Complex I intermediate-associated protein n=1 Tax=Sodiomyces alkalinus (strain CBS 110278 / VKM F-3762 / F11) TaxID=1314773 RepID=A0A3N2Q3W4_SODAK|nr:complex I intermediate-associated protein [Sodiomyces alkalinus F11]ROT41461.1 complex I intermediate-associated protein [Sodiomyces alkalinus F11]